MNGLIAPGLKDLQIGMASEYNSKKIPSFALIPDTGLAGTRLGLKTQEIPISTTENLNGARDGVCLSSIGLDPDATAVLDAQQMVNDFKAFLAFGIVYTADVHDTLKLTLTVVSEKSENGDDSRGGDVESELVIEDRELLDEFWETLGEVGGVGVEGL